MNDGLAVLHAIAAAQVAQLKARTTPRAEPPAPPESPTLPWLKVPPGVLAATGAASGEGRA